VHISRGLVPRGLVPGQTREEARAGLRPGKLPGHASPWAPLERGGARLHQHMNDHWFGTSRFKRRARVTWLEALASTGTVRLGFEVADGKRFESFPGSWPGSRPFRGPPVLTRRPQAAHRSDGDLERPVALPRPLAPADRH
jgi:hypothetical protein